MLRLRDRIAWGCERLSSSAFSVLVGYVWIMEAGLCIGCISFVEAPSIETIYRLSRIVQVREDGYIQNISCDAAATVLVCLTKFRANRPYPNTILAWSTPSSRPTLTYTRPSQQVYALAHEHLL